MRTEIKLFVTIWLVYAVYITPAGGVGPNRYMDLIHSIVNEGRFAIDTYHENTIDKSFYNGHYYAGALPGPAFLAVPAYIVSKGVYAVMPQSLKVTAGGIQSYKSERLKDSSFYGRVDNVEFFFSQAFLVLLVLAPFSALGSVLIFKTILRMGCDAAAALIVTLLYAFGSIVFFYSTTYFEQVFSATLGIAAFYMVLRIMQSPDAQERSRLMLLAGFLSGCGLLVEYTTIFFTVWLVIWVLLAAEKRKIMFFVLGFAAPMLILMAYDYALFGNPLDTPYAHLIKEHESVHGVGFFGATYPHWDRLAELLVGARRGLFLYVPITMAGFWGLFWQIWKRASRAREALVCMGIIVTYLVFFCSYTNWQGGSAFGPHYLIPTLPFLFLGVVFAFETLPRKAIYLLGAISLCINWAGAQFGFAESALQHIRGIFIQGPTLPLFGAILTHSSSDKSQLYMFASRWHSFLTLGLTIGLTVFLAWTFKDVLWGKRPNH